MPLVPRGATSTWEALTTRRSAIAPLKTAGVQTLRRRRFHCIENFELDHVIVKFNDMVITSPA